MQETKVFLFGTLRHDPLLTLVAGTTLRPVTAWLPGERCDRAAYGDWPVLVADAAGRAEGVVVSCDAPALDRLDRYEAVFGYGRRPVTVATADGPLEAQVWRPDVAEEGSGEAWDLAAWVAGWGDITLRAAADIMRRLDHQSPAEVARVAPIIRARAHAVIGTHEWHRPGMVGSGFGPGDVEIVARRHPYDGFFSVEEVTARFRRFDGDTHRKVHRSVFCVTDAATVLPYDPVRDRILLLEQLRFGPLAQGDPAPWLLEPVAGLIDAGETPEETARREAAEEAGLAIGDLHFVGRYYPSPGGVSQVLHSFLGLADLPDEAAGLGGHEDEGEDILAHVISFDTAMTMLRSGDLVNAPTIITLQWLAMHRPDLRAAAGLA